MKKIIIPALFTLMLSLIVYGQSKMGSDGAIASDAIGQVRLAKGNITIIRGKDGKKTKASKGLKVYQKDIIKTQPRSFIRIAMIDETIIQLGPKSIFKFESFTYKSATDRKSIYNFVDGKLRTVIKNKAKKGDITIKARSVAMGIRGTEILSEIYQDASGESHTKIALLSGKVNVDATNKGLKTIKYFDLGPGKIMDSRRLKDEIEVQDILQTISDADMTELKEKSMVGSLDFVPFLTDVWDEKKATGGADTLHKRSMQKKDFNPNRRETDWNEELQKLKKLQRKKSNSFYRAVPTKKEVVLHPKKKSAKRSIAVQAACKTTERCIDYKYYKVKGKLVPICIKKEMTKGSSDCRDINNP